MQVSFNIPSIENVPLVDRDQTGSENPPEPFVHRPEEQVKRPVKEEVFPPLSDVGVLYQQSMLY